LALNLVRDGELKVAEQVRAGKHEDMVAEYAYETDDDETADDRDS
jgi:hypothetical protein